MNFLLFDDHKIFCRSFKLLLKTLGHENVFICDTPEDIQQYIDAGERILIFSDYVMPGYDIPQLLKKWKTYDNVQVIVMSGMTNSYQIASLFKNKADGFISKSAEPEEISLCIKQVLHHKTYISKEFQNDVLKAFIDNKDSLFTPREIEIIQLIKEGKSIKEKAKILFLSENTVIVHRRNIMKKAGVNTVTELILKLDQLI